MTPKARTSILLLTIFLLILTACTKPPVPQVVPSLAVLPSATPTDVPTSTLTPTATDTLTATITPSETPSPTATLTNTAAPTLTPSPTFTASLTNSPTATYTFTSSPTSTFTFTPSPTDTFTFTPTATFTPSDTPTATLTPSSTVTPTLTPSNTPLPTVTPPGPQIISFGANMTSVLPNTTITLAWVTLAESARLEQLSAQGGLLQSILVLPQGQYTIAIPGNMGRVMYFRLVATRNGIDTPQTITINIACPFGWFFGDQYVQANAGCPTSLITSDGRYQAFERGLMVYVSANGFNHVYGLQYDGSLYIGYANGWDGSTLNTTAPPSGRFMPQEMFNWAYYNTLAPIGSWNSALGWATATIINAPRSIQWENGIGGSNPFYIDAPDGGVYHFSGGESGTWSRVR